MKSLFSKYVWLQLILSILLLFGGALIIIFAAMQKIDILDDALNIIIAVILFLFGGFAILASFVFEYKKLFTLGLLIGSASIAFGIFFCVSLVNAENGLVLFKYLTDILAIFFITLGGVILIKAIIMTIKKTDKVFIIVIAYIAAAIAIAAGILALIFRKDLVPVVCIIAGVLLVAAGIYELVFGVSNMIKSVKEKGGFKRKKNKKNKDIDTVESTEESFEESEPEEPQIEEVKEIDYTDQPKEIEQK